jgi:hypothetical protein
MLLAEFWGIWWNPFTRSAYASQNINPSENERESMLEGNRGVVKKAFGVAV